VLVMAIGADILLRRVERALALRMGEQLPEAGA